MTAIGRVAVLAISLAPTLARAQSVDLVLCDRLAADPADPDKPTDVKDVPDVAPPDVATAIKFCKVASGASRRAVYENAAHDHPGALERMGAFAQSGRGGPKASDAAKAYYERAAALGDSDAKAALERLRCPYVIKDRRGTHGQPRGH